MAARIAGAALVAAALAAAPLVVGSYYRSLILAILADVALAVAWASFSGPTRYLSLATGAFFGAGAYATAVLVGRLAWPLPVAAGAAVAALMAPRWTYLDPQVFNPVVSFQTVIMALVGGATTVIGPALGAVFLGLAGEILLMKFRYFYLLGLGLALIVAVLALPGGLAGLVARRREPPPVTATRET